jgi:hypothetical protein
VSATLGRFYRYITKQDLGFRFTKNAVESMQAMYEECMNLFKKSIPLNWKILRQFNRSQVGNPLFLIGVEIMLQKLPFALE